MNKKEIVKHFYEVIVSSNLLEELYKYVSEDCVLISGDRKIPLGLEGMKEHLAAVKQTYVHVLLGKHADTGNVVRNQTAHAGDSAVLTSMYSAMRRS